MAINKEWKIEVGLNDVLQAQGVPSASSLRRSSRLIRAAEWAAETANAMIDPIVIIERLKILSHAENSIQLEGGYTISGKLVKRHLAEADEIYAAACTVSGAIEKKVQELQGSDLINALALDAAGTAAVEKLSTEVRNSVEEEAEKTGKRITLPLNPGMMGWPLEEGQAQVFSILSKKSNAISLNSSSIMDPYKSLSFVIGAGTAVKSCGVMCDYCAMQTTCRYSMRNLQRDAGRQTEKDEKQDLK